MKRTLARKWLAVMIAVLAVASLSLAQIGCQSTSAPAPAEETAQPKSEAPAQATAAKPESKPAAPTAAAKPATPVATKPATAAAGPATKIRLAHTFIAGALGPMWVTLEGGYFAKYGLDPEVAFIQAVTAEAALITGEVDFLATAPDELIPPIAGGGDLVVIAAQGNHVEYKLVGGPTIKKPEDLKGKKLAISKLGASSDYLTRAGLEKLGVSPDTVTILGVGGQGERASALLAGNVDATVVAPPSEIALQASGMNLLADLGELGIPYVSISYAIRRDTLQKNPDLVERFLKASAEGLHRFKTDPEFSKQVLAKKLNMNDTKVVDATYQYYLSDDITQRVPYISMPGLQYLLEQTAKAVPAAAQVQPERVADMSVVKKLDDSGFYKDLYK